MTVEKSTLDDLRINRNVPEKKSSAVWVIPLVGTLILCGSFLGWRFTRFDSIEVRTFLIVQTSVSGPRTVLNASGYVTARRQATVSSKVTGKVIEVLIEEGKKVESGQILARLDASNVEASLRLAETQFNSAKTALNEKRVLLAQAQTELRRITSLAANQIASASDLDRARADVDSLKARLDLQEAEVSVAERQVNLWQQQMDDTIIRAPFSGIVVSKNAQPGEMISPISAGGGFTRTGIGTIVDMASLEIEIDVNESYINRVTEGQPVEATLDAYPEWKIPCKVIAIIPTADRQKTTVKVRVGFEKLDSKILPDMGVKVAFHGVGEVPNARPTLTIPKAAIRRQDGRDIVFVILNDRAERRAITLGAAQNDERVVLGGLNPGEKVVIDGPAELADGSHVKEKKQ